MKEGQKFLRKDITGESVSLKATAEVDTPLLQALTDESEGLLKAGALPQLQIATTGGNKILLDSVEKVGFLGMWVVLWGEQLISVFFGWQSFCEWNSVICLY